METTLPDFKPRYQHPFTLAELAELDTALLSDGEWDASGTVMKHRASAASPVDPYRKDTLTA